ncbi:citrate synthase/methylcitrate synthase [Paenibacillus koleovorans]|uniref:citrate synthase/methylcitrate synthase n=1 Tax=Paenibacillus koleovorans TaxID=121608 RepID=UPI000FD8FF55|nr:citrate synthase/methylcitrate synthase [Paenibacillus koleovorans]
MNVVTWAKGLEGVVAAETKIGLVDGTRGLLVYRGEWARELAVSRSFEETAYLLWYGVLPKAEELAAFRARLASYRAMPEHLRRLIDLLPADQPMMGVVRTAVSALGDAGFSWPPTVEQAMQLTAVLPSVIAYRYRRLQGLPPVEPFADDPSVSHAAHYLYLLDGELPSAAHARALDAYLILTMEHGLNASTFASRVVASTESDLASAVCAGIGAMKGPLHGGAPSEVIALLEEIGEAVNAEAVLAGKLERGEKLMGFGHRVYKTMDPRAEALREVTAGLNGGDPWFDFALHVEATALRLLEQYKPGRKLYTNVEFFASAVLKAVRLDPSLFTPTFTASRIVGWTAHVLEQAEANRIYRPQSIYTGATPE